MKTSKMWIGFLVSWLGLAIAAGCLVGPTGDPTVGSESHFLSICGADSDCPPDLACTCGICTFECSEDDTCTARGQSRCVASADLAATCTESASLSEGICVARCTDDAQCQAITPGTACTADGWCEPQGWDVRDNPGVGDVEDVRDNPGVGDVEDVRDNPSVGDVEGPNNEPNEGNSLTGPPGGMYDYMGRIGNRLYFSVSRAMQGTVAYYEPGRGWSVDRALTEVAAAHADRWVLGTGARIVEAGDTSYIYFGDRLFRSADQGASWEALDVAGATKIQSFGVDQSTVFLLAIEDTISRRSLLRSLDAGLSWEMLGDFSSNTQLAVLPGLVIRLPEGHFSTDGGQTWQTHPTCQNLATFASHWYVWGERFLYIGDDGVLTEFDPNGGCSSRQPSGLEGAQGVTLDELLVLEDQILGVTQANTGGVFRIAPDLSRAELVPLPDELTRIAADRSLFDLGDDGVALYTDRGLMASVDALQTWNFVGHHLSSPHWFVEVDGVIYAPGADGVYGYDQSRWTFSERYSRFVNPRSGLNRLLERSGRLFLTQNSPASLYEFVDGAGEPTLLWQHPEPSGEAMSADGTTLAEPAFISEVLLHEDRIFIASNRWFHIMPEEPDPSDAPYSWDLPSSPPYWDAVVIGSSLSQGLLEVGAQGGGVFAGDLTGTSFEPLDGPLGAVVAMAIFEEHVYVATSFRGVWRANLDGGQWADTYEGLPNAIDGGVDALPVIGLHATAEGLFATTTDAIYRFEGDVWRLIMDGFQGPLVEIDRPRVGLSAILLVDGRLLAVSWDGIYELDVAQGLRNLFWAPTDHLIRRAAHLSSGLYVGLHAGGVQIVGE